MGGSSNRTNIIDSANQLIATSFLNISTKCHSDITSDQTVTVECLGNPQTSEENFYEDNPACIQCYLNVLEQQKTRYQIIRNGWKPGSSNVPLNINTDFDLMYQAMAGCLLRCKACVFQNLNQTNQFSFQENCNFDISEVNQFSSAIQATFTQALTDNQDILSSLAQVLGSADKQSVVSNIMSRLNSNLNVTFMNNLSSHIATTQQITLRTGSTSVSGVNQISLVTSAASFISRAQIVNRVLSNEQWAVFQKLYNSENTIGELGNIVRQTELGLAQIVTSLSGKILIGSCVLLAMVIALVAGLAIYNAVKKRKLKDRYSPTQLRS